ncbi:MAG: hypothetical protein K6F30_02175 [Lachnospiraceae bacterium]|nr:hypothetical protein [Lachnospiraceae bacterium]
MKKNKRISLAVCLFAVCTFLSVGCGKEEAKTTLNGTYTAGTSIGSTTYTFTEDENVVYEYSVGGQTLVAVTGTYTINDDGEVITMVFPKEEIADVPVGVDVGGTFALVVDEEEEYVTLNGILFSKA